MESFETRSTDTHVPPREERAPTFRSKLWMAGAVVLAVGVGRLVRRRYVREGTGTRHKG